MENQLHAKNIANSLWKILIIDDDEDDYKITLDMLKEAKGRKIDLHWANTYAAGREELNSNHYNAVLVDYDLGIHSGIELIREANQRGYASPLILFTGRGNYEVDIEAMEAGATLYLTKGEVNPLLLERAIRYAIELKHKEQTLLKREAELRKSTEALRESENRERAKAAEMNAILDAVPAIVWVTYDTQAEAVTGNQAAHDFLRVPLGNNLSMSAAHDAPRNFKVFQEGRELAPHELPLQITAATGQPIRNFEEEILFEDGDRAYLLGNVTPLLDDDGKPRGAVAAFINITERKQAEQDLQKNSSALRASESKYQAIFQSSPFSIILSRLSDGQIVDVNLVWQELFGLTKEEAVGRTTLDLGAVPDPETRERGYAEIREHGHLRNFEMKFRRKTGEVFISLNNAEVIEIDGTRYLLSTTEDITQRKLDEATLRKHSEVLRESEERFRRAIMVAPYPLIIRREDGKIIMVNEAWTEITGYSIEDIPTFADWIDKAYGESGSQYQTIMTTDDYSQSARKRWGEFEVTTHSGEKRTWDFSTAGLGKDQEGSSLVLSMAVDVTERKRAEQALRSNSEALRKSEEKFAKSFRASPVAIAISTAADGRFIEVNDSYTQLFGFSRDELIGHTSVALGMFPDPEERKEVARRFRESGGFRDYEIRLLTKKGDPRILLFSTELIEVDQQDCMLSLVIDITERKQAEAALQDYAEKLKYSNQELEQFAFIASHDLQEPLRKISMFSERLREHLCTTPDGTALEYLNRMQSAAARMQMMINGLLDLSRVNSRGRAFAPVSLTEVVEEAVSDLESRIHAARGQVLVAPLPDVEADEMQIRQLFQNLIGNAIKFHQPHKPPIVRISVTGTDHKHTNMIEIRVSDNGIGFDPQFAERIFQPFQRLHGRNEYEGTGLGLAICQKIVERHQGTITVESVPDQGSTFIIRLPVRMA